MNPSSNVLPLRILMVDDNPNELTLLREAFASIEVPVELDTCTTGQVALGNLYIDSVDVRSCLPDLLLLDIHMPLVNGVDLLRGIKANERLRHIPVVMITSNAPSSERDKCRALGALDVIQKPDNFDGYRTIAQQLMSLAQSFPKVNIQPTVE